PMKRETAGKKHSDGGEPGKCRVRHACAQRSRGDRLRRPPEPWIRAHSGGKRWARHLSCRGDRCGGKRLESTERANCARFHKRERLFSPMAEVPAAAEKRHGVERIRRNRRARRRPNVQNSAANELTRPAALHVRLIDGGTEDRALLDEATARRASITVLRTGGTAPDAMLEGQPDLVVLGAEVRTSALERLLRPLKSSDRHRPVIL